MQTCRAGEKVLAHAAAADGTWLLGTREPRSSSSSRPASPWLRLGAGRGRRLGPGRVDRCSVTGIGEYGEPRPAYALVMQEPALLLQLLRERVTASIVLQRRVPVRGTLGLTVIGRRSPVGGPVAWMHAYDAGLDPDDPEVAAVADEALVRSARH